MSGISNYPTALDDDSSLHDVIDSTTPIVAAHHNNLKEAVKALEAQVGVYGSDVPASFEYRLGSATDSHSHNGASGQGQPVDLSSIVTRHPYFLREPYYWNGTAASSLSEFAGILVAHRTMQLESIDVVLGIGPTVATTTFDVWFGPTHLWGASMGLRPIIGPTIGTAIRVPAGTPNLVTIPSGAMIGAGFHHPAANRAFGPGLNIVLVFRE